MLPAGITSGGGSTVTSSPMLTLPEAENGTTTSKPVGVLRFTTTPTMPEPSPTSWKASWNSAIGAASPSSMIVT